MIRQRILRTRRLHSGVMAMVVGLAAAPAAYAQSPAPQADEREVRAKEMFAVGKYSEALEIYGRLYAETTHPTYMRNIGRCYQNLGEPDKAISSFREYLRQARDLAPNQRVLVEGYIKEMEDLKRRRGVERAPAVAHQPPSPPIVAAPPASPSPSPAPKPAEASTELPREAAAIAPAPAGVAGDRTPQPSLQPPPHHLLGAGNERPMPWVIAGLKFGFNQYAFRNIQSPWDEVLSAELAFPTVTGSLHLGGDGYFLGLDVFYGSELQRPIRQYGVGIYPLGFGHFFKGTGFFLSVLGGAAIAGLKMGYPHLPAGIVDDTIGMFAPRVAVGGKWLGKNIGLSLDLGYVPRAGSDSYSLSIVDVALGLQLFRDKVN